MPSRGKAEEALQTLRRTPPREFTRTRAELARRLTDEGARDAAAAIKRVRKPSGSVWGVAVLAREDPQALRQVLEAGEAVRREQRRAVSGGGAGTFREATKAFYAAVSHAGAAVQRLLRQAGESATPAVIGRVRDTLLASAEVDAATREALEAGQLEEDLSPSGFGSVSALRVLPGGGKAAARASPAGGGAAERKESQQAERRQRQEREREERQRRQDLERERRLLRRDLERSRKAVRSAEAEERRLAEIAAGVEERARAARDKANAAREELAQARRAREATERRLEELSRGR